MPMGDFSGDEEAKHPLQVETMENRFNAVNEESEGPSASTPSSRKFRTLIVGILVVGFVLSMVCAITMYRQPTEDSDVDITKLDGSIEELFKLNPYDDEWACKSWFASKKMMKLGKAVCWCAAKGADFKDHSKAFKTNLEYIIGCLRHMWSKDRDEKASNKQVWNTCFKPVGCTDD